MNMKNIDYKAIIEFLKTPRGKAFMFFGFYFIFFFILAVLFRMNPDEVEYKKEKKKSSFPFSISMIESGNYHFKYNYMFDSKTATYEGDRNDSKELFSFNKNNYYRNNDVYLISNNGIWVKSDNPYKLSQFIEISSIKKILKKSKYISKTDYESGMKVYTYQVSTDTLIKLFNNQNIDLDDKPNEIVLKTDKDNNVNVIKFDISSYSKYNKFARNMGQIELNYTKFGEIKEIDVDE